MWCRQLILLLILHQGLSWKIFHLGRNFGGNLGEPYGVNLYDTLNVSEKYFDQYLDHFTPTDGRTWKQVTEFNDLSTMFKQIYKILSYF